MAKTSCSTGEQHVGWHEQTGGDSTATAAADDGAKCLPAVAVVVTLAEAAAAAAHSELGVRDRPHRHTAVTPHRLAELIKVQLALPAPNNSKHDNAL